jgi:sulfoxide reductase heme-binding subunit YedZ
MLFIKDRKTFLLVWTITILLGPISVFLNLSKLNVPFTTPLLLNIIQRVSALIVFTMLFWQIVLGAYMPRWTERLGGWIFRFHLVEGAVVYSLIFLHPLVFLVSKYIATKALDPFYVFTGFCVLCQVRKEFFYTFGRLAFWLISAAVLAAKLRNLPWWKDNWRKFHILNYPVFFLAAIHSFFIGTDGQSFPFIIFYAFSVPIVLYISVSKIAAYLKD